GKAWGLFAQEFDGLQYPTSSLSEEVGGLIERLLAGIPPDRLKVKVPDFRSAIAAGWFYRTARISIPYTENRPWTPEYDDIVSRLVLKGIESIELVNDFNQW